MMLIRRTRYVYGKVYLSKIKHFVYHHLSEMSSTMIHAYTHEKGE